MLLHAPVRRRWSTRHIPLYLSSFIFALLLSAWGWIGETSAAEASTPPVPPGLRRKQQAEAKAKAKADAEAKSKAEAEAKAKADAKADSKAKADQKDAARAPSEATAAPLPPGLAKQRAQAEEEAAAKAEAEEQRRREEAEAKRHAEAEKKADGLGAPAPRDGGKVGSSLYVRTDTDNTQIISPEVHFRKSLGSERNNLDIVYIADIWSSASVDIRSAATKVVREQRDEINVGLDRAWGTTVAGLGYRYSHEVDYVSHALSLSLKYEAFQRNTSFDARVFGSMDEVGRSGDSSFAKDLSSTGVWLGISQVLGKRSLAQISAEIRWSNGFMSSPYRYVPIGGVGACRVLGSMCLPEVHPNTKTRIAAVARWRFALAERVSLGLAYRFYYDNWKIMSHTALGDIAFRLAKELVFSLGYRGYGQSAAFFYQRAYAQVSSGGYITRDRELSRLQIHQGSARVEYKHPLLRRTADLVVGLMIGQGFYRYREFAGLDRVRATEVSTAIGVEF